MAERLEVRVRSEHGKRRVRRLRNDGGIPAVLYGHGQESISLTVPAQQLVAVVRQRSRLVELVGGADDTALIREVQWDPYGLDVLHVDFVRVSADERVQTSVIVEMRGEAPGVNEGGVVEQLQREVNIECSVAAIPEKLELNINSLKLGDSITAASLPVPEDAHLLIDAETVVVQCVEPMVQPGEDDEAVVSDAVEPEVIGRKEETKEEGE